MGEKGQAPAGAANPGVLSDMNQLQQERLQQGNDAEAKARQTLNDIEKGESGTAANITNNIK